MALATGGGGHGGHGGRDGRGGWTGTLGPSARELAEDRAYRDALVNRWLANVEGHRRGLGASGYGISGYGRLFTGMKGRGAWVRAHALNRLYGGDKWPDPYRHASYSEHAIIGVAMAFFGLSAIAMPVLSVVREETPGYTPGRHPLAWLQLYPAQRPAQIAYIPTHDPDALHFTIACLLAFWDMEQSRLVGATRPGRLITPPSYTIEWCHQFAKGLLFRADECPPGMGCSCNQVLALNNQPPAGHEQATDALDVVRLQRATQTARLQHTPPSTPLRRDAPHLPLHPQPQPQPPTPDGDGDGWPE